MMKMLQITTNPLRMLRSGNLTLIKPRLRTSTLPTSTHAKQADRRSVPDSDCIEEQLNSLDIKQESISDIRNGNSSEENPIPLPPRDRNKTLLTSKARHTRKHPLIIPASANLQRTLDKVTVTTPPTPLYSNSEPLQSLDNLKNHNYSTESIHFEERIDSELSALDNIVEDQDCVDSGVVERNGSKVQSHHVSCEDLLEFADAKPSSRARGSESDEVRIMSKVLGKDISKEQCLAALEHCDWDVLKAIKIAKLQRLATGTDLTTCENALDSTSWDITRAAQWILSQDGDVLQV